MISATDPEIPSSVIERVAEQVPQGRPRPIDMLIVGGVVCFTAFAAIWLLPYFLLHDRIHSLRSRNGGPFQ